VQITIDYNKCPPCSELVCIDICPWGVFQQGPDKKPQLKEVASCTVCGLCESLCPSKAIKIKRKSF